MHLARRRCSAKLRSLTEPGFLSWGWLREAKSSVAQNHEKNVSLMLSAILLAAGRKHLGIRCFLPCTMVDFLYYKMDPPS